MAVSFEGHWYPGPLSPPQPWMKLPALSNSITGGAGVVFVSGDVDRGCSRVCGRLRIHTWSSASTATADPNPIFHFAGTVGQAESFSNCGNPPSPIWGASADAAWLNTGSDRRETTQTKRIPAKTKPIITERFMGSLLNDKKWMRNSADRS